MIIKVNLSLLAARSGLLGGHATSSTRAVPGRGRGGTTGYRGRGGITGYRGRGGQTPAHRGYGSASTHWSSGGEDFQASAQRDLQVAVIEIDTDSGDESAPSVRRSHTPIHSHPGSEGSRISIQRDLQVVIIEIDTDSSGDESAPSIRRTHIPIRPRPGSEGSRASLLCELPTTLEVEEDSDHSAPCMVLTPVIIASADIFSRGHPLYSHPGIGSITRVLFT